MTFVDTNYFLRFLLRDNEDQYLQAKKFFTDAALERLELISSTTVFFEIHFVLKSFYGKDKLTLIEILSKVLNLSVSFEQEQLLNESLILYVKSNNGLEDCYNIVYAKMMGVKEFKTFDVKLDKVVRTILEKL